MCVHVCVCVCVCTRVHDPFALPPTLTCAGPRLQQLCGTAASSGKAQARAKSLVQGNPSWCRQMEATEKYTPTHARTHTRTRTHARAHTTSRLLALLSLGLQRMTEKKGPAFQALLAGSKQTKASLQQAEVGTPSFCTHCQPHWPHICPFFAHWAAALVW